MPLLDSQPDIEDSPEARFPKLAEQTQGPSPSFLDTMGAAFRSDNLVGQLYSRIHNDSLIPAGEDNPNFNPIEHIPAGYLHDYGSRFLEASNPEQIEQVRRQIDAEKADQGIIARAGIKGTAASLAAGLTDPLNLATMALVPEAAPTRLGNALRWGLTNAAITGVQEAVSPSVTRTPQEKLLNIGAGAVLGGILGSVARRVPAATFDRLQAKLGPELAGEEGGEQILGPVKRGVADVPLGDIPSIPLNPAEPSIVNPGEASTAGAAAVERPDIQVARGGQTYNKTIGAVTPAGRILNSESEEAKKLLTQLANIPGTLEQNYHDIATPPPVERDLWRYDGLNVQGIKARRAAYGQYVQRISEAGEQPMSRRDFMDGVSMAMRRGDQSPIPEIAQAAKWTRQNIFDPLWERAQAAGLAPEEAKLFAESYLTRQYDAVKIRANMGDWIDRLRKGFISQGVDPAEATDIAHQATRNVLGSERGLMDWHVMDDIVPKSGQLKERTLALPDTLLEPYLNNDIDHLSHSYLRSLAPEVEMTERFGSRDLKDQIGAITDEYAHKIEQARAANDLDRMAKLDAQRNHVLRDISAIRDRLYGVYGAPKDPSMFFVRAGRVLRQVNALRLLGAATLAHFPDLANVISRFGMKNTFGAMAKLATSMDAIRLSIAQAQRMGAAIDMTMNITASLLGDYGSHSQFLEQRIASKLARGFTIATGETPLITAVQAMTSTLAQDEILRVAQRLSEGRPVAKNLAAKLAASGLDEQMLRRIAGEASEHAHEVHGLRFGMSDAWRDQRAARAFESAVVREAHGVTLRPGVGDTPLLMSTEWGKSLLQFKSFAYAASRLVGMPIAQGVAHGDLRTVEALAALTAMGTLSYVAKQKAAGQPLETNPGRLALEVLDKSNLMGWTGELIFPALWQAGFKDLSRWSDRDPVETLLGPSAGLVASTWERQFPGRTANLLTGGAVQPNLPFRRSDLHFLRRMAPGQNLWYFRRGVNFMEDQMGDLFNLPGESNEQRQQILDAQASP